MKHGLTKEERFEDIYRTYSKEVYQVCLHFVKNDDLAQDLMQQTFVNSYEKFEKVKSECMLAYLTRAARNLAYNCYRNSRHEIATEEIFAEGHPNELISESLEEEYFRSKREDLEERLGQSILNDLRKENKGYYDIFTKMFFGNKSNDEISEELGISKETLYSRTYRAKQWVHKRYKKAFEDLTGGS